MTGFAFCGSYCTLSAALREARRLLDRGEELLPIFSFAVSGLDSRFSRAADFCAEAESLCGRRGVYTIAEAEPLGPFSPLAELIICPCTGNTAARLAAGITDSPVTMAAKAHLRRDGKILLAPATNDALGTGLRNLGELCIRKNYFFVPMRQDDTVNKPYSLVSDFTLLPEALDAMRENRQLRPLFR